MGYVPGEDPKRGFMGSEIGYDKYARRKLQTCTLLAVPNGSWIFSGLPAQEKRRKATFQKRRPPQPASCKERFSQIISFHPLGCSAGGSGGVFSEARSRWGACEARHAGLQCCSMSPVCTLPCFVVSACVHCRRGQCDSVGPVERVRCCVLPAMACARNANVCSVTP